MTTEIKITLLKSRVELLKSRGTQCSRIIAKLQRKIRNLEGCVND